MAVNLSEAVRNARLDAIETSIGASPILRVYTGAKPATTADSATGTLLAEITLGSNWAGNATSGTKAFSDTPLEDSSANATGSPGYWRLYEGTGSTCHMQGTCGIAGSGADMILSASQINAGSPFSILSWSLTDGNA